jgi:hypothetical protein
VFFSLQHLWRDVQTNCGTYIEGNGVIVSRSVEGHVKEMGRTMLQDGRDAFVNNILHVTYNYVIFTAAN